MNVALLTAMGERDTDDDAAKEEVRVGRESPDRAF